MRQFAHLGLPYGTKVAPFASPISRLSAANGSVGCAHRILSSAKWLSYTCPRNRSWVEAMANGKQASAKRLNMSERAQQLLDLHFPGVEARWIWRRKSNDGFTTIPRTLPIVMQAIDEASKGTPPGHVLFCLWSRAPDNPLLSIENPATFAAEAGFGGERAVDTWRKRMKRLRENRMIETKPGASGEFHYVLLLNPNLAMAWMRWKDRVQDVLYGRFLDRLAEVGAFGEIEGAIKFWEDSEVAEKAAEASAHTSPKVKRQRLASGTAIKRKGGPT